MWKSRNGVDRNIRLLRNTNQEEVNKLAPNVENVIPKNFLEILNNETF